MVVEASSKFLVQCLKMSLAQLFARHAAAGNHVSLRSDANAEAKHTTRCHRMGSVMAITHNRHTTLPGFVIASNLV